MEKGPYYKMLASVPRGVECECARGFGTSTFRKQLIMGDLFAGT